MAPRTSTHYPALSTQNQHLAPSTQNPAPVPVSVSRSVCVVCGEPNSCGVAAGRTECWCFTTKVPQALLETLPPEKRNLSCICQVCIASFEQQQHRDHRGADETGGAKE